MLFDCSAAPPGTASVLHPSSNQFYFAGLWGAIVLSLCKWVKVLELSMQNGNFSFFFLKTDFKIHIGFLYYPCKQCMG